MKIFPLLLLLVIFLCGTSIGVFIGQKTAPYQQQSGYCVPASHDDIDTFYNTILGVTEEQRRSLAPIEKQYLKQKKIYTSQMADANRKLAQLIEDKGYDNEEVARTIMEIHTPMGGLQHLTLQHLAQIRSVLTDEQAELLKAYVVERLRQNQ